MARQDYEKVFNELEHYRALAKAAAEERDEALRFREEADNRMLVSEKRVRKLEEELERKDEALRAAEGELEVKLSALKDVEEQFARWVETRDADIEAAKREALVDFCKNTVEPRIKEWKDEQLHKGYCQGVLHAKERVLKSYPELEPALAEMNFEFRVDSPRNEEDQDEESSGDSGDKSQPINVDEDSPAVEQAIAEGDEGGTGSGTVTDRPTEPSTSGYVVEEPLSETGDEPGNDVRETT